MEVSLIDLKNISKFIRLWVEIKAPFISSSNFIYGKFDLNKRNWFEVNTSEGFFCFDFFCNPTEYFFEKFNSCFLMNNDFFNLTFGDDSKYERNLFGQVYDDSVEYIMFSFADDFTLEDRKSLYYVFHGLSFELNKRADSIKSKVYLPNDYIKEIKNIFYPKKTPSKSGFEIINMQNKFYFHDVSLTSLELRYISCLLSFMSYKEIAYSFGCSDTAVRKKILTIKEKMGNYAMSNSTLFKKLKEKGVIKACFSYMI